MQPTSDELRHAADRLREDGQAVREMRERAGLNQMQLAQQLKRAGITRMGLRGRPLAPNQNYITRVERGVEPVDNIDEWRAACIKYAQATGRKWDKI